MTVRLVHYSDVENACDDPERMARLAGTIRERRDTATVVVGTGDNTGPGVLAHFEDGKQSLPFFRAVGTDVETFGNHDFDYGTGALRETVAESPQEWIAANVYEEGTDPEAVAGADAGTAERFAGVSPTTTVARGGRTVGFVGVLDPATTDISAGATELTVTDPVAAARSVFPDLSERADHVVVLAHLRTDLETEVATLDGVDAVLGGHVHAERHEYVDGTLVVRPGAIGEVVWEVELPDGPDRASGTRRRIEEGPVDGDVVAALRERMASAGLAEVVATVENPVPRDVEVRYTGECRVGNLVADAYRWAANADVGFAPNGGLRDGRPLSGEVTAGDVASVTPFGGELQVLVVEGKRLRELAHEAFHPDRDDELIWHGHFSGLEIEYDPHAGRLASIRVDDRPLDDDREYRLATTAFAAYDDGWPVSRESVVDTEDLQFEVLIDYAREVGIDEDMDGRLTEV